MNYLKKLAHDSVSGGWSREPSISFEVVEVAERRNSRQLQLSEQGVSLHKGNSLLWARDARDVCRIKCAPDNKLRFTISTIQHHEFEANDERQVRRILDAFQGLHLGQPASPQQELRNPSSVLPSPEQKEDTNAQEASKHEWCLDAFQAIRVIGEGSFGQVLQVRRKSDGEMMAMKIVPIKPDNEALAREERAILSEIDHPYLVKMLGSFEENHNIYMLLEYESHGDLYRQLQTTGCFKESVASFLAAEVVLALDFLHKRHIVYRDLKPENLLLSSEGHVKLIDMGLAKKGVTSSGGRGANGSKTRTFCGTPQYQAPEILIGIDHGFAVDWWSLGILLFELLTGSVPFYSSNRNEMYRNAIQAEIVFPSNVSKHAQSFIRGVLVRRPQDRLGSGPLGVFEIKNHAFFANIDWTELERRKLPSPLSMPLNTSGVEPVELHSSTLALGSVSSSHDGAHHHHHPHSGGGTIDSFICLVEQNNDAESRNDGLDDVIYAYDP